MDRTKQISIEDVKEALLRLEGKELSDFLDELYEAEGNREHGYHATTMVCMALCDFGFYAENDALMGEDPFDDEPDIIPELSLEELEAVKEKMRNDEKFCSGKRRSLNTFFT